MIGIILPFHNEEKVFNFFLDHLNDNLKKLNLKFLLIFIDDFSSDNTIDVIKNFTFHKNISFRLIRNFSNLGNQKSIKAGLDYAIKNYKTVSKFIIMDTDGEDDPANIKDLIENSNDNSIVVAKRGTRTNSFLFLFFYKIYKIFFKILIGKKLDFGNYSIISKDVANHLVHLNFVHYSAFLLKLKYQIKKIKIDRAKRISGNSKVNFDFLIYHALFSILEVSEILFLRILRLFIIITTLLVLMAFYILHIKFIVGITVPGWASLLLSGFFISELIIINTIILGLMLIYNSKLNHEIRYNEIL